MLIVCQVIFNRFRANKIANMLRDNVYSRELHYYKVSKVSHDSSNFFVSRDPLDNSKNYKVLKLYKN